MFEKGEPSGRVNQNIQKRWLRVLASVGQKYFLFEPLEDLLDLFLLSLGLGVGEKGKDPTFFLQSLVQTLVDQRNKVESKDFE